ncbi:thiol-disulfide oxidoreductase DCC family protein [Paenibacillus sp.]|uniref:thiol-disulfide oxidoreductase DCC family protein n=1 Tax=Paenibacillus sp. TaxID=58172 RepID=UPI002D39C8F7|nr:thiol-disulfide oxidoreductase DCC family protein [Paenibacillus sp.]HZG88205.1 thiol-disulfide oxidoreductase DCC family protein [Paenibacillus sp.]
MKQHAIVLYDGECNMCNAVVQFTIVRNRGGRLRYAAQQSDAGRRLLAAHGLSGDALDTFVLIEGDRAYTRSEGALRLMKHLNAGWPLLSALRIVPRPLRDPLYTFVARNRYRWFGKSERCMLMRPEYRDKFLT